MSYCFTNADEMIGLWDACQKDNLTPATGNGLNHVRETVRGQEVKNALNIDEN